MTRKLYKLRLLVVISSILVIFVPYFIGERISSIPGAFEFLGINSSAITHLWAMGLLTIIAPIGLLVLLVYAYAFLAIAYDYIFRNA